MTKHVRRWNCEVCGAQVIFDDVAKTITCKCGTFRCSFVNPAAFIPVGSGKEGKLKNE